VLEIPARKKSAKVALLPFPDGVPEGVETIVLEVLPGENYAPSLAAKATLSLVNEKAKKQRPRRPSGGGGGGS
jgi:hypothetical protein